ncbi:PREDICTED: uncharacterized protein LOC107349279 [Acropora digitifera]|uniref:uncharacterized protein LOC107349279 n=1 Tax=Acropora digitifera TaxID=70779 RepID=UPI00077A6018|nr:PREDICTED: uncharacterized protein LOC107349279 [Acropora digitifera]
MIDSIGEEKKNIEHRLSIECGSLLEKYETERKTAGALRAELQQQISTFEEKSNEWKGQKDNMASKHKEDQDNFKKKDYTVNETKDPESFDEAIGGGLHSSPRGEQQRPVLSLTSSNEDEPTRSLEQRVTSLKSNNAQLEKELVEMGERLDELEDRRINYLTQEGADEANQPGNYPASKQPKSTGFRVYSTGSNYRQSRLSSSMPSPPKFYK